MRTLLDGAGSQNRTDDPRITSAVLYQLSYAGPGMKRKTGRKPEQLQPQVNPVADERQIAGWPHAFYTSFIARCVMHSYECFCANAYIG